MIIGIQKGTIMTTTHLPGTESNCMGHGPFGIVIIISITVTTPNISVPAIVSSLMLLP